MGVRVIERSSYLLLPTCGPQRVPAMLVLPLNLMPAACCPVACCSASEGPEGRRTAVVVLKIKATGAAYPRKPGVPGRKPL